MTRPAILGAGSWGTALALVLARKRLPVTLWAHNPEVGDRIRETRFNNAYLPGFPLPSSIRIERELAKCVEAADCVILATPSHAMRTTAALARPFLDGRAAYVSASKGLEENTLKRMSEVLTEVLKSENVAVLSGPSFAREVAQDLPTALVAASRNVKLAEATQQLFSGSHLRVYSSTDPCGVELGGAMKNVIAIAAGVCYGLGLGQNAVAALITRGLAEMSRLASALGARPETLSGLAGLGDLVLTCHGELSRNRNVGIQLASGKSVESITAGVKTVAEGIKTANSIVALGQREKISLPISHQMHAVLHGRLSPAEAIRSLLERSLKEE